MIEMLCASCGSNVREGAKFCPSCGNAVPLIAAPRVASTDGRSVSARHPMSGTSKTVYALLVIGLFAIFIILFENHLPGKNHPVIASQPEIAMASMYLDQTISPQPIDVSVENGKISFSLPLLLEKKMIEFEYKTPTSTIPLLAYISPAGKLVTAVRVCEPCNSHTFRIEGTEMACGNCETRWKLDNLEGLQGSCQKYPPDPIPSRVVGNLVQIDVSVVENWKMRI